MSIRLRPTIPALVLGALVLGALVLGVLLLAPLAAIAQTGPTPVETKARPNPYGSPLDTLMSTHLWTDVPPAKDFVTTTRPDAASVDYTPLTGGKDPERPKPRDAAGVAALQAELEAGGMRNEARAKGTGAPAKTIKKRAVTLHPRKPTTKASVSAQ